MLSIFILYFSFCFHHAISTNLVNGDKQIFIPVEDNILMDGIDPLKIPQGTTTISAPPKNLGRGWFRRRKCPRTKTCCSPNDTKCVADLMGKKIGFQLCY
ncbi:hypothetical protein SNEBB_010850 [Seison nebaliae]|nr:hypothetical protein SNEBB_010850 [Seison nebaliae]